MILHTIKARFILKVVILPLWRVNVKTTSRIYVQSTLADFFIDKTALRVVQLLVGELRQYINKRTMWDKKKQRMAVTGSS